MNIRECKKEEVADVIELLKCCGLYYEPCDSVENISNKIDHDKESILVAEIDGKIVGMIFLIRDPWASLTYHLCVHEDYRRRGIGKSLLLEAENRIKKICSNIGGYAVESNTVILNLKKSLGYSEYPEKLILTGKKFNKEA